MGCGFTGKPKDMNCTSIQKKVSALISVKDMQFIVENMKKEKTKARYQAQLLDVSGFT